MEAARHDGTGDPEKRQDGPEFEVWNHLDSGLELARNEFEVLDENTRATMEKFGEMIVRARRTFALGEDQRLWLEIYDLLLDNPWYRHAAEIELGWEGINRASESLRRFTELRPVLTSHQLTHAASEYLREVVDTFLFGFDAACIALAGAAVEQVLRDLVVAGGLFTEARLNRERPLGQTLLEIAKREGLLSQGYASAKQALEERNRVMHRQIRGKNSLKAVALQSIKDLGQVLTTLGETREQNFTDRQM